MFALIVFLVVVAIALVLFHLKRSVAQVETFKQGVEADLARVEANASAEVKKL